MKKRKRSAAVFLLLSGAALTGLYLLKNGLPERSGITEYRFDAENPEYPESSGDPEAETAEKKIVVHVAGCVKLPGVYELPEGARVGDAVTEAGGFSDDADTAYVNLAMTLSDGVQIVIPALPDTDNNTDSGHRADGTVNINTASVEDLMQLPGIGEAKAEAIADYRKQNGLFRTIEEIREVPGIGDAIFEQIRDKIRI